MKLPVIKSKTMYQDAAHRAAKSSELARKYLFALIDDTNLTFMGHTESDDSKRMVAVINQQGSAHEYAAMRQYREEGFE